MITRTLYLLTFTGGLTAALVGGCGGKVIIDGMGNEGGQGGQVIINSSYVASVGGDSTCGFPAPIGKVTFCGTSGSSDGSSVSCSQQFCDQAFNTYAAICENTSCFCTFASADGGNRSSCMCTLPSVCSSTSCCPFIP